MNFDKTALASQGAQGQTLHLDMFIGQISLNLKMTKVQSVAMQLKEFVMIGHLL